MQDIMFLLESELKVSYIDLMQYPAHIVYKRWRQIENVKKQKREADKKEKERLTRFKRRSK